MNNTMKRNRQNHTPNGRTHKSSSHNFIEHWTKPKVRTCLQQRTNYLQWNEKGIHMFVM